MIYPGMPKHTGALLYPEYLPIYLIPSPYGKDRVPSGITIPVIPPGISTRAAGRHAVKEKYRSGSGTKEKYTHPLNDTTMRQKRPDHEGPQRSSFEKNKKKILLSQDVCGICGKPVNKKLKYPDPMSACIDHIIPIDRGGDPSAIENLQLAHLCCNRQKSDKIIQSVKDEPTKKLNNRDLPLSFDWANYKAPD